MSTFKGTFWDRRAAFHTIYIDNKNGDYHKIGMRDSNLFNWERASQNKEFNKLAERNNITWSTPLYDPDISGEFQLKEWDKSSGEYVDTYMSVDDLLFVLRYWENKSTIDKETFDQEYYSEEGEDLLNRLLLSIQKCATYITSNVSCYVYLLEQSGDNQPNVNNTRFITGDNGLMITDSPARPTGGVYSYQDSVDNEMNGSIGSYFPVNGKPQAKDKVTGKLRLSYDKNSETWGIQNQVLAQLIEALEPAEAPIIDLSEFKDGVDPADNKEYYSVGGSRYIGAFKTAEAVVLSKEGNNPNMFGPNMLNPCSDEMKMEVIRVVNRTSKSYKQNQLVMCHLIDNEWIATEFGKDPAEGGDGSTVTKVGRWEFSKFFCNYDTYFTLGIRGQDGENFRVSVNPETINRSARYRTYNAYLTDGIFWKAGKNRRFQNDYNATLMLQLNKPTVDAVQDSTRPIFNQPYQLTDFDQLGPELAGLSSISYIGRTNLYYNAQGDDGSSQEFYTIEYPTYWGAVFPDGFKSRDYGRVRNNQGSFFVTSFPDEGGKFDYMSAGATISASFDNVQNSYSEGVPTVNGMFVRGNLDPNVRNLPASVGINGRWSETSSPLIGYQDLFNAGLEEIGDFRVIQEEDHVYGFSKEASVLTTDSADGSNALAMEPVNPNRVTFTSLTAEMACHTDPYTPQTDDKYDRDFAIDYIDILTANRGVGIPDSHAFGGSPNRAMARNTPGSYGYILNGGVNDAIYNGIPLPTEVQQGIVAYDAYNYVIGGTPINVTADPFWENDAGNSRGAGMCGVQGARNVISKGSGGVVNIDCECSYGINGDWVGGSSGGSILSIVMGVAFGTSSQASRGNKVPGWGSTDNDDIDSFGTTALHVKVYDYWPEESTHYLPTYHTVFHFNPGVTGTTPVRRSGTFKVSSPNTPNARTNYRDIKDTLDMASEQTQQKFQEGIYVNFAYDDNSDVLDNHTDEVAEYIMNKVDFRVPTYGYNDPSGGEDGKTVPLGKVFDGNTEWRPLDMSNILTGNRGMMLSGADDEDAQFLFPRLTGGFSDTDVEVLEGGSSFVENQVLEGPFGSQWKITNANDGVVSTVAIHDYVDPLTQKTQPGNGEGVTPRTLGDSGYVINFPGGLRIKVWNGVIVQKIDRLYGPKLRVPKTRLSAPSRDGKQTVFETKSTTINLDRNNGGNNEFELENPFAGRYEFFYLYHNDISHTYALTKGSVGGQNPPITQYITMTIN
jgi:hypothetical protein